MCDVAHAVMCGTSKQPGFLGSDKLVFLTGLGTMSCNEIAPDRQDYPFECLDSAYISHCSGAELNFLIDKALQSNNHSAEKQVRRLSVCLYLRLPVCIVTYLLAPVAVRLCECACFTIAR